MVKEGSLNRGDKIERVFKDENKVLVSEFNHVLNKDPGLEDVMFRASKVSVLPQGLKDKLTKRLSSLKS